jgi:enoyl-CoA hydratase
VRRRFERFRFERGRCPRNRIPGEGFGRGAKAPAEGTSSMPDAGQTFVRVERRGGVVWVTLDRPPLNLLVPDVIRGIKTAFDELTADPRVRVVVLTGRGRAMTAGMQLQFLRDLSVREAKAFIGTLHDAIHAVHEAPCPTICMMNGHCLGGGFELAMACDLRIAAAGASMGLPEIRVGVPSVIEAALLPRLIGPARAAECLLTGESITAEQALAWGLVNRVVPSAELTQATTELVDRILACAPGAVRLQKELIVRWRNTDLRSAVEYGINAFAQAYATGEPREAMQAFLDKRAPRFE